MTKASGDWHFGGEWPYEPRWFDTAEGQIHYIDEGPRNAPPVIMVHGNATWSYVYRRFIRAVTAAGHRAIAFDHLGFGRSEKPTEPSLYTIPQHARRCEALLNSLGLRDATMVVQDWGGPIGLCWAARQPDRVKQLFLLNTFLKRPTGKVPIPLAVRLLQMPVIGEALVQGMHFAVRHYLFERGLVDPSRLSSEDRAAYLAPHPSWESRTGLLAFPRQIPSGPDDPVSNFVDAIGRRLVAGFADKPVKIVWAMQDIAYPPSILDTMWLRDFPNAEVRRIENAGHLIQEDAHERVIPELLSFIGMARQNRR